MIDKPTTNIQIFKSDRDWLKKLFGEPAQVAFHNLIILCPHPDKQRKYTSAIISDAIDENGNDVILEGAPTRKIHGFRCGACNVYVFPDPRPKA